MTVETAVFLILIALWVLTPVLIFLVMRFDSVRDGLNYALRLPGKTIRAISMQAQQHVVEPIHLTFDEEAKARRREMIERDTITIGISELQKELDFAELKATEYRMRIADPNRTGSRKKLTKKAIRFAKKQKHKSRKSKDSTMQTQQERPTSHSGFPSSPLELQNALLAEERKIEDLKLKIADLEPRIDQLDIAAVLREAKESEKMYEDLLGRMGRVEELSQMKEMETAIDEKLKRMQAVALAHREALLLVPPAPAVNSEGFRELVEKEKAKILEKRAKLPSKEELAAIEKLGTGVNRFFSFHRKINDFVARVDPGSDRAFARMYAQFEHALKAQEVSKQSETKLQTDLTDMLEKIAALSERIATLDGSEVMSLTSTRTTLEAAVIDLEATLNSLRRKIRANEDRLFEIASVIERLQLIRSMLTILPVTLRDHFDSLIQIVNAGCAFLIDDSLGTGVIEHIGDRLSKLEHSTMMVFIKIAKGETKSLRGRELSQFKQRLHTAAVALMIEREELINHKERWDVELNAVEEDQPDLLSTALYRRDHYAKILGSIDRGLDVISILRCKLPEATV